MTRLKLLQLVGRLNEMAEELDAHAEAVGAAKWPYTETCLKKASAAVRFASDIVKRDLPEPARRPRVAPVRPDAGLAADDLTPHDRELLDEDPHNDRTGFDGH